MFFTFLYVFSSPVLAATSLGAGNNSAAPINNLQLNFSWYNTSIGVGINYNSTMNVTFNLPSGITYISGSAATNVTGFLANTTLSNSSFVAFGNTTGNDTSNNAASFAFNISASAAGAYTITVNENYNRNGSSIAAVSTLLVLNITNGTITLTNATFSNFSYTGNSMQMNFTGALSSATGGGSVSDNVTFNLYLNGIASSSNYTCSAACLTSASLSYTNATSGLYTLVFNTSGTNNYTATSLTAVLNISTGVIPFSLSGSNVSYSSSVSVTAALTSHAGDADVNYTLWRNNTLVSSGNGTSGDLSDTSLLAPGLYYYVYNATGGGNWTVNSTGLTRYINVTKGVLTLSISGSNTTFPNVVSIAPSESNVGDADVNYTFYRNSTLVSTSNGTAPSGDTTTSDIGWYNYTLNATGGANWTANSTGFTYLVQLATGLNGASCSVYSQCSGGYCIHGYCRSDSTYCGDNNCDSGETCGGCAADCGACPTGGGLSPSSTSSSSTTGQAVMHISSIAAGGNTTFTIASSSGVDFSEINVQVANKVSQVYLTVTKLDTKPTGAPDLQKVYNYFNVVKENLNDQDISSAKIKFKVQKSWMTSNGVDASSVALFRYSGGSWNQLTTTKLSEDSNYTYFEAATPGFSYFAISLKTSQATTTTSPVSPVASSSTIPAAGATTIISVTNPTGSSIGLYLILLIVVVIILIVFFGLKGRKKKHHLAAS